MEIFPLYTLLAGAFISLLAIVLLLNIFGLPANWIILGLVFVWKLANPAATNLGFLFWALLIGLAILGEILEFVLQVAKARRYGSSSSGTFGGMVGAFAGAILLAPLFWGIGALIGALLGAWCGCYVMEIARGRSAAEAMDAAMGTMLGKFLGTVCKIGMGAAMIVIVSGHIWTDAPGIQPQSETDVIEIHAERVGGNA